LNQYSAGSISLTDLEQLRLQNPAKYDEMMGLINQNDTLTEFSNELYGTEEASLNISDPLDLDGME